MVLISLHQPIVIIHPTNERTLMTLLLPFLIMLAIVTIIGAPLAYLHVKNESGETQYDYTDEFTINLLTQREYAREAVRNAGN